MRARENSRKTKVAPLAQIIFIMALLSFVVLPKATPAVRTEALFSAWRQTEGTFGDRKTAHSRTQSRLFLTSWQGVKTSQGQNRVSQEVLLPWREKCHGGVWGASATVLPAKRAAEGGRSGVAALWEFWGGDQLPVGT